MKYYKLLTANEFVGIATTNDFVRVNPTNGWLLTSDENLGQFISYNNQLYRDFWMQPIPANVFSYITVNVVEITEEEYNTIKAAIDNHEEIIIDDDDDDEPYVEPVPVEDPDITVEYVRAAKINEMSRDCRTTIEAGFDLVLRGDIHHFSLTTQDQLNLMSLSAMIQTEELIPYHADGEECTFYTADEINQIIAAAASFKNYQIAYNNALKTYINALDTMESIAAITYGTPIPDEYKSDVLKVLE